jgi:carboxymethylenebutenolidase
MARLCAALFCLFALTSVVRSRGAAAEPVIIETGGRPIEVTRHAAAGEGQRPAVLVLHGSSGLEADRAAYGRYAQALAARGIDAYLMSYYAPGTSWACGCWDAWAATVLEVAHAVRRRPESSGRIGLLGFSLGGGVAVASARDPRITALVIFYGALPDRTRLTRPMPPLLVLHGDADTSVPLRDGVALVDLARRHGSRAELVTYPGAGHRLSTWGEAEARDAVDRMIAFLRAELIERP